MYSPHALVKAYTPAKIQRLCAILVTDAEMFGDDLRRDLLRNAELLFKNIEYLHIDLQPEPVRQKLTVALQAAADLINALEEIKEYKPAFEHLTDFEVRMDDISEECVQTWLDHPCAVGTYTCSERLERETYLFGHILHESLKSVPRNPRGRRPDFRFRLYVKALKSTYEWYSGVPAKNNLVTDPSSGIFSGPFYSFVKINLDLVRPDHGKSNGALARQIRTVVRERPPFDDWFLKSEGWLLGW